MDLGAKLVADSSSGEGEQQQGNGLPAFLTFSAGQVATSAGCIFYGHEVFGLCVVKNISLPEPYHVQIRLQPAKPEELSQVDALRELDFSEFIEMGFSVESIVDEEDTDVEDKRRVRRQFLSKIKQRGRNITRKRAAGTVLPQPSKEIQEVLQQQIHEDNEVVLDNTQAELDNDQAVVGGEVKSATDTGERNTCDVCSYSCTSGTYMRLHKRVHSPSREHSCSYCTYRFDTTHKLAEHIRWVHRSGQTRPQVVGRSTTYRMKGTFPCPRCDRVYTSERRLHSHLVTHSQDPAEVQLTCVDCDRTFEDTESLATHMHTHVAPNVQLQDCPVSGCSAVMMTPTLLQKHMQMMHCEEPFLENHKVVDARGFVTYECHSCSFSNPNRARLVRHLISHTPLRPFKCLKCDVRSKTDHAMIDHIKKAHPEFYDDMYAAGKTVTELREELVREAELADHQGDTAGSTDQETADAVQSVSQDSDSTPNAKSDGPAGQKRGTYLKYRLTPAHVQLGNKPLTPRDEYECQVCGRVFDKVGRLRAHIRTHTGEKPFNCDICRKGFASKESLRYHIITFHSTPETAVDVTYHYDESGNIFYSSQPAELFKCEVCGRTFPLERALKRHLMTHESSTEYSCDQCSAVYKYKTSLDSHRKIEHGIGRKFEIERLKPGFNIAANRFECPNCHQLFKWRKSLVSHTERGQCTPSDSRVRTRATTGGTDDDDSPPRARKRTYWTSHDDSNAGDAEADVSAEVDIVDATEDSEGGDVDDLKHSVEVDVI